MDDTDLMGAALRPTATRPLLGMTVLVVEDSRFACDALRLLCMRSGARIRRADCLASAYRHLKVYRPTAIILDVGLPDGSGLDMIEDLVRATPRIDVILGTSGDHFQEDAVIAAGADGFLAKPIGSIHAFQSAILSVLPPERQPPGPRLVSADPVRPDMVAFRDDMAHAAEMLGDGSDGRVLDYIAQFLSGVALSAGDDPLSEAAEGLAVARAEGEGLDDSLARVTALVQDRLTARVAI